MTEETDRPDINPEWSLAEKILQIVCFLILAVGLTLLITSWSGLPATVPTHFNFSGAPDSYGVKSQLIILPIIAVGLYLMLTVFERFPKIYNFPIEITESNAKYIYQTARELFVCLKTEIIAVFAYLIWGSIETAKGLRQGLGSWFITVFLALLAITFFYYIMRILRHKGGE